MGPLWRNAADLVLTGWENVWITPALDAMEELVLLSPHDDADEEVD